MVQRPIPVAPLVFVPGVELGGLLFRQTSVGNNERWPLAPHQTPALTFLGAGLAPVLGIEVPLPRRVFARFEAAMPLQLLKTTGDWGKIDQPEWRITRHVRLLAGGGMHF
jgi:hypothetical protein